MRTILDLIGRLTLMSLFDPFICGAVCFVMFVLLGAAAGLISLFT